MFGRKAHRIAELTRANAQLHLVLNEIPRLVNIRRDGRELIITFQRGNERYELITYSTGTSDVKGLKQWANLP